MDPNDYWYDRDHALGYGGHPGWTAWDYDCQPWYGGLTTGRPVSRQEAPDSVELPHQASINAETTEQVCKAASSTPSFVACKRQNWVWRPGNEANIEYMHDRLFTVSIKRPFVVASYSGLYCRLVV